MKIDRRDLLLGSTAVAASFGIPGGAKAWFPHGASQAIPTGWNTLRLGCGGLATGFDIAPDGTMAIRTDVGNCYRFSGILSQTTDPGKTWLPLMNLTSLGGGYASPSGTYNGACELVVAYSQTTRMAAILPNSGGAAGTWALWVTNDGGASWTKTSVAFTAAKDSQYNQPYDGGSNGIYRTSTRKAGIDPNNADVIYCGTPFNTANAALACWFRSIDGGTTCSALTTDGTTPFGASSVNPGGCGILFDTNYTSALAPAGTVTVSGQIRTARVIIGCGGLGVYETIDGGQTWTETGTAAAMGRSDIAVHQTQMDYDGVIYALVVYGEYGTIRVWRYAGAAARGSASNTGWLQLDNQTNFPLHATVGWLGRCNAYPEIVVDPRNGSQGFLSVNGPNGISNGFTSHNANLASNASVTWGGRTGGATCNLTSPAYDCRWLAKVAGAGTGYIQGTYAVILSDGSYWWAGNQGALWKCTLSDLSTATILDYSTGGATSYHVSTSRGTEVTVSQMAARLPGAPNPLICAQDVGIFESVVGSSLYPTDFYPSPTRSDCTSFSYDPADPSFVANRVTVEFAIPSVAGYSGYSSSYGETGTWTSYANQPDALYEGHFTATVNNGSGVSGNILMVTAVASGNVLPGAQLFPDNNPLNGNGVATINRQLTNTNGSGIPYQEGTYEISGNFLYASATMAATNKSAGGQTIVITKDIHMIVPYSSNPQGTIPAITTNARTGATWNLCTNLPIANWCRRGYASGGIAQPLARDPVTIGQCYALVCSYDTTLTYFQGSIAPGVLTVTQTTDSKPLSVGQNILSASGGTNFGNILSFGTVNPDGTGTYNLTSSTTGGAGCYQAKTTTYCGSMNASISANVLTVNSISGGVLDIGSTVYITSVVGTIAGVITARGTGLGGTGTYTLDRSPGTYTSVAMVAALPATLYKSIDSGANWSVASTLQIGAGGNYTSPYMFTMPGQAGNLFITSGFTGGGGSGIFFSNDAGASWTKVPTPSGSYYVPNNMAIGYKNPSSGAGYGTIYYQGWGGYATTTKMFYGDFDPVTKTVTAWNTLGATGTPVDFPAQSQTAGLSYFSADYEIYGRLYAGAGSSGFNYFQM